MEKFEHPWFGILADVKKKARDNGLTEDEAREIGREIIRTVRKELKISGSMLEVPKKYTAAVREIAEKVLNDYLG